MEGPGSRHKHVACLRALKQKLPGSQIAGGTGGSVTQTGETPVHHTRRVMRETMPTLYACIKGVPGSVLARVPAYVTPSSW